MMKLTKTKLIVTGMILLSISFVLHYVLVKHDENVKEEQAQKAVQDFIGTHEMKKSYQSQVGSGQ